MVLEDEADILRSIRAQNDQTRDVPSVIEEVKEASIVGDIESLSKNLRKIETKTLTRRQT